MLGRKCKVWRGGAHRGPVVLDEAASVAGVGVPGPPEEVVERGVGQVPGVARVVHERGHVRQEQHVRLLRAHVFKTLNLNPVLTGCVCTAAAHEGACMHSRMTRLVVNLKPRMQSQT